MIKGVQTFIVDFQLRQGPVCNTGIHDIDILVHRKVPNAPQQSRRNPWGSPGAGGDFVCALVVYTEVENARGAGDDEFQLVNIVEIEPHRNAEPVSKWRCQQTGPGCGTDQSEIGKFNADGAGGGSLR